MKRTKRVRFRKKKPLRLAGAAALFALLVSCQSDDAFKNTVSEATGVGTSSITISGMSPGSTSVVVLYGETQDFVISASSGFGPITFTWSVDGGVVKIGTAGAYTFPSTYAVGNYVVRLVASDGVGSETRTWNVKVNGAPVISSPSPTTECASPTTINKIALVDTAGAASTVTFSVTATDPNNDALNYEWKLDGNVVSTATNYVYTAALADVGNRTIDLTIRDGASGLSTTQSATCRWSLDVNQFGTRCNTLAANQACSYGGMFSSGGVKYDGSDRLIGTDPATDFRVYPEALWSDSAGTFVGDSTNNVIWYWNRSGATVNRLGKSINAGRAKVVVGNGYAGNVGVGNQATNANINRPKAIVYDEPNGDLYFSDYSNNRVLKVSSSGILTVVTPITGCTNPMGVAKYGDLLYISCWGNHRVISHNVVTTAVATVVNTAGTAGNAGDGGAPGAAQLNNPGSIAVDNNGNLYIAEYSAHRIRFVNMTGSNKTFYGTTTINAGQVGTIAGVSGAASNTNPYNETTHDNTTPIGIRLRNPYTITLTSFDGGTGYPHYIWVADYGNHLVRLINISGSAVVYNGVTFSNDTIRRFAGAINAANNPVSGYSGQGDIARSTRLNNPIGVALGPTGDITIADYTNRRVRTVNASTTVVTDTMGNGLLVSGYVGSGVAVMESLMDLPYGVAYDSSSKKVYFSNYANGSGNSRIQEISRYGVISDAVGRGDGATLPDDEIPSNVYMNRPSGIAVSGNFLVFVDRNNQAVRAWNRSNSIQTLAGVSIGANRVSTIGGSPGIAGCTEPALALDANLTNPEGVTVRGTDIYVSDTGCHCVRKINSSGQISTVAGTCGTNGNANTENGNTQLAASVNGRINQPKQLAVDSAGNALIFADWGNNKVRAVGLHTAGNLSLHGGLISNLAPDYMVTVACGGASLAEGAYAPQASCNRPVGVAISGSITTGGSTGKFCYSVENHHNVRCVNLTNGAVNTVFGIAPSGTPLTFTPLGFEQEGITGTSASLAAPKNLTFDENGDLYIADYLSQLVRKIKF